MKVLIVSDTHGYDDNLYEVIEKEKPIDMLVHCGDIEHSVKNYLSILDCPIHVVGGNNDFMLGLPEIDRFDIDEHTVVLTHGHRHRVHFELTLLTYLAEENGADVVMFGHLHEPMIIEEDDITIINPGSLTYPRQKGGRPSYVVMTTNEDDTEYEIKYL